MFLFVAEPAALCMQNQPQSLLLKNHHDYVRVLKKRPVSKCPEMGFKAYRIAMESSDKYIVCTWRFYSLWVHINSFSGISRVAWSIKRLLDLIVLHLKNF